MTPGNKKRWNHGDKTKESLFLELRHKAVLFNPVKMIA